MTIKDEVYKLLQFGPMTDDELEAKLEFPRPSIRRSRNELVKEGRIEAVGPGKRGTKWRTVGWDPAVAPVYVIERPTSTGRPGPTPAEKPKKLNPADWVF